MRCCFFSSVPWLVDNLADFQSIIVKIRGSVFEQHRVTFHREDSSCREVPGPHGLR